MRATSRATRSLRSQPPPLRSPKSTKVNSPPPAPSATHAPPTGEQPVAHAPQLAPLQQLAQTQLPARQLPFAPQLTLEQASDGPGPAVPLVQPHRSAIEFRVTSKKEGVRTCSPIRGPGEAWVLAASESVSARARRCRCAPLAGASRRDDRTERSGCR